MKITNNDNLPGPLYRAASGSRAPISDTISVTELIGPPMIRLLKTKHWDALEEDASDRIWSVLGTALHQVLEWHSAPGETISEKEFCLELEYNQTSICLVGHPDCLEIKGGILSDWKLTSVWSLILGDRDEWVSQLNLYAWLLRQHGHLITKVQNVVILRDWSRHKARYEQGYPKNNVETLSQPLWDDAKCLSYVIGRLDAHFTAEPCSASERWERSGGYAVIKAGAKKALKVHKDPELAQEHADRVGAVVEQRFGEAVRCADYCPVRGVCPDRPSPPEHWRTIL